ncbi:MAG: hypothetical protein J1F63_07715 [Oscillospiraceae bacterium]|nr:hypothetical protein [Oscillospiraceae bacterium]
MEKDSDIISRLHAGEAVGCLLCGKGHMRAACEEKYISICHCFICDHCGAALNIDEAIDITDF